MEITTKHLRYLAHFGNATVKLDRSKRFAIGEIRRDGIYIIHKKAIVSGKRTEVKISEPFPTIYKHILTIKQGSQLVAERRGSKLEATTKFVKKMENSEGK